MRELRVGGEEHKQLFCREFIDTHHPYEVRDLEWPHLESSDVERLRALPFWQEAVSSEHTAAAQVAAMADAERDPLVREAIAMQAYEEARHARLLESLTSSYGITVAEPQPYRKTDAEWGFMRMGYGECFDSFFAFGLFRLASDTGFFPPPLVKVFDGVMQEEARHILFFTNWVAHRRRHLPPMSRPLFMARRAAGLSLQALGRIKTALQLRGADEGDDFTMQVPESIGEFTLRRLAETCLGENQRRLAVYDARLLRPRLVPRLVGLALRMIPGGKNGVPAA
jgi:hypothetical protein